jgi:hypothetical protein
MGSDELRLCNRSMQGQPLRHIQRSVLPDQQLAFR